jgi:endonuclease G
VPQVPAHDSGAWSRIESDTRSYAMRAAGVVHVATGAVFDGGSTVLGQGQRVWVPTVRFKLVHDPATGRSWAHWQQNAAASTAGQPITREELLQRLGYDPMPGAAPAD